MGGNQYVLVPLVLGVTIVLGLGIIGITGFSIRGVVLTIDWGGVGGTNVSTKDHDLLVLMGW